MVDQKKGCAKKGALRIGFLESGCLVEGCCYFVVNNQNWIFSCKMPAICRYLGITSKTVFNYTKWVRKSKQQKRQSSLYSDIILFIITENQPNHLHSKSFNLKELNTQQVFSQPNQKYHRSFLTRDRDINRRSIGIETFYTQNIFSFVQSINNPIVIFSFARKKVLKIFCKKILFGMIAIS